MTKNQNLAVARRCGARARAAWIARDRNPFPPTEAWAPYRGAWYEGWDKESKNA